MTKPKKITPRPHCPRCRWQYVKRNGKNARGEQRYACKMCSHEFAVEEEQPKTKTGSGQIAGRITVPGYRWGATRLG